MTGRNPMILITNDDGIDAPGLRALAAAAVAASPAFIVMLALRGAFGGPPGAVLSGINRGANAGHAVLHSGTVGAALTAANDGLRAIAVSLDVLSPPAAGGAALAAIDAVDDEARRWPAAAALAVDLWPALCETPAGTVFNLNVPDLPPERIRGLRRAALARFGQVQVTVAEAGEGFLRTTVEESAADMEPGTDVALLAEGYATLTPLRPPAEHTGLFPHLPTGADGSWAAQR